MVHKVVAYHHTKLRNLSPQLPTANRPCKRPGLDRQTLQNKDAQKDRSSDEHFSDLTLSKVNKKMPEGVSRSAKRDSSFTGQNLVVDCLYSRRVLEWLSERTSNLLRTSSVRPQATRPSQPKRLIQKCSKRTCLAGSQVTDLCLKFRMVCFLMSDFGLLALPQSGFCRERG